ncbi:Glyoxylase, beta-lactamase superfamily II [Salinibacillus kushneri]|uniref:Glyoxylase, beta-lactamase superfamily II n=1 Tax=Salinibacillus kushneri TaxID=237682 RepID=A0A1I0FVY5_9BACI|nr:MBL fold metallo-hydrolase [Salinibacillus kushneri]SET62414.1 Glyoxylase, beta-lactamase superfamily II [Salinibacillus kushneri]
MNVKQFSLGALGTNCYIVHKNGKGLIIDPGAEGLVVKQYLDSHDTKPLAILLTHAHFDHIGAVEELQREYNIEVYLHETEHDWLKDPMLNGSQYFGITEPIRINNADHMLTPGFLTLENFTFEIRHTPGHSPGSVSFVFEDEGFVIAGDTLFNGGIGRTDLPQGNHQELLTSIKTNLFTLAEKTIVYPGHGPETTIEKEKRSNPFL